MNKKAALEVKEILEIVLAGAGVFIIFGLIYFLLSPGFDKNAETAKSYFNTLRDEIKKADSGNVGEFGVWENENMYLIYFDDEQVFTIGDKRFILDKSYKNYVCVCYINEEDKAICKEKDSCMSLKNPADFTDKDEKGRGVLCIGQQVLIQKQDNKYVFTKTDIA